MKKTKLKEKTKQNRYLRKEETLRKKITKKNRNLYKCSVIHSMKIIKWSMMFADNITPLVKESRQIIDFLKTRKVLRYKEQ